MPAEFGTERREKSRVKYKGGREQGKGKGEKGNRGRDKGVRD